MSMTTHKQYNTNTSRGKNAKQNPKQKTKTKTNRRGGRNRTRRHKRKHIMVGGEDIEPFQSKGIFEIASDSMLYILTNIVKLSSNMVAASVGYSPVNNNLGTPGSAEKSGVFDGLQNALTLAKIPAAMFLKMIDGVVTQYIKIINGAMRVNAPMLQASLTLTITILKTQLKLATATLNNPAFITVLRTTLTALEQASDEIVGAIDPVAASILAKLSPIITRSIGMIFATIGTSAISGMQSMPYVGTVLAALSSFDAVTRLFISSINATTATGTVMFDGYTDTVYRLADMIKGIKDRIAGTASGMNNPLQMKSPAMPTAPAMPAAPTVASTVSSVKK